MNGRIKLKIAGLCLPAGIGFAAFYILPFAKSLGYSVLKSPIDKSFVGLEYYKSVISNEYFRLALKNTLLFSLISVAAAVFISLAVSLSLMKLPRKLGFIRSGFVMPYVLPTASIIFIWQTIFRSESYSALSEIGGLWDFLEILPLYLLFIWKNIGIDVVLLTAALGAIPKEIYEAASLDSRLGAKIHLKITLPLISPTLFFVIVLSFVNSLKIFKESYLFYNTNYPPDVAYMVQNFMNNHFYKLNYQTLSCAAAIFTFSVGLMVFALYRLESRLGDYT